MKLARKRLYLMALAWAVVVVFSGTLSAQVTTADVVGRVSDASGASVPAAHITLDNLDTHNNRAADSNEAGDFNFNVLPPGRYSVKVEKSGFKVFSVQELVVAAGDRARVDAQLAVGQTSETVEVSAQAALFTN